MSFFQLKYYCINAKKSLIFFKSPKTDQTMQYVKSLEQKIKQLEEDKSILQARAQGWPPGTNEIWESPRNTSSSDDLQHLGSRPEAVVRALQVLEVREQLEREAGHDGEKALVREMCNVRKYLFF